jgi:oligoribonuclease
MKYFLLLSDASHYMMWRFSVLGIFLDTETNGLNPRKHKLVELAYKIVDVRTGEEKESYQAIVLLSLEAWQQSDPESLQINRFTWEEVVQGKRESDLILDVVDRFNKWGIKRGNAVFICQNPSFDRAFFSQLIDSDAQERMGWPYHWLDLASMYWAESVRKGKENPNAFPWVTGFSKDKVAMIYQLPTESKPHRAMNGVNHLLLCYQSVVGFPCK